MKPTTRTKGELYMEIVALRGRLTVLDEMARGLLQPDHPLRLEITKPVVIFPPHAEDTEENR